MGYAQMRETTYAARRPAALAEAAGWRDRFEPSGLRLNRDRHLHRRMDAAAYVIDAWLREGHHDLHIVGVHPLVFGTAVRVVDGDVVGDAVAVLEAHRVAGLD